MPDIEALATEFDGRIRFVKVDVDKDETVREQFGISGIPRYLVFKDGVEVDRVSVAFTSLFFKWRIRRMLNGAL